MSFSVLSVATLANTTCLRGLNSSTCCPVGGALYKLKLVDGVIVEHVPHSVSLKGATLLKLIAGFDES